MESLLNDQFVRWEMAADSYNIAGYGIVFSLSFTERFADDSPFQDGSRSRICRVLVVIPG